MYVTGAEIETRMGAEAYKRLFDKDKDGTADPGVVAAAIDHAESIVNAKLAASHGTPFDPVTVPAFVKNIVIMMVPFCAVMLYPGNSGAVARGQSGTGSPFEGSYTVALEMLKDLARDDRARLPSGPPKPTSTLEGPVYGTDAEASGLGTRVVSNSSDTSCGRRPFWQKPRFWDF